MDTSVAVNRYDQRSKPNVETIPIQEIKPSNPWRDKNVIVPCSEWVRMDQKGSKRSSGKWLTEQIE
jgi:hypothetical protein